MAEEPHVIRGINWREAFPFTNLFRAFRIAIHPSKLVLALLALLALYFGGRILDGFWIHEYKAVPGEIEAYETSRTSAEFTEKRNAIRAGVVNAYVGELLLVPKTDPDYMKLKTDAAAARNAAEAGKHTADVRWFIAKEHEGSLAAAKTRYEGRLEDNKKITDASTRAAADEAVRLDYDREVSARNADFMRGYEIVRAVDGKGLFLAFFQYQTQKIDSIVRSVLGGNWLGGLDQWTRNSRGAVESEGVIVSVIKFFTVAPSWALRHHPFYFLLFGALFLFVWSLFGGAIARIAAVHVADEGRKLSVRQGLSFAVSKFLSFISAPMIPLIIVVGIGLVVAVVAGIALLIPYLGEIIVGVFFFLALAAGFVMTLVLIGTAGGFNLMYPTIAVEGSDSFDAISRSFSYVYAKPWRMLFYSAVAIAYGAIAYLFVRLFIYLTLLLTWFFVGLFVFRKTDGNINLWHALMPRPSFASLPYETDLQALTWAGSLGSFLVAFWNYLTISMLGAFAISFYFSVNTVIYYLMRREVDATELDDVYLEQPEEEFTEAPSSPTLAPAAAMPVVTPPSEPATTTAPAEPSPTEDPLERAGPAKTYDNPPPET